MTTATQTQQTPTQEAKQHSEGIVARTIEQQTAKLPSDIFLWGALGSIGLSLFLKYKAMRKKAVLSVSGYRLSCCSEFITSW